MTDTTRITVYGCSDDLVEIEGDIEGADEYNVATSAAGDGFEAILEAPDGATARLYVEYRSGGTWTVTLGQYEEDYQLPAWPVVFVTDFDKCRYSTVAHLTVPVGTTLKDVTPYDEFGL